jgi:hypothetical protein
MNLRSFFLASGGVIAASAAIALPTAASASPNIDCGSVKTAQGTVPTTTFGAGANCKTAQRVIKAVVTKNGYRRHYRGWTCEAYKKVLGCGASGARNAGATIRKTTAR